MAVARAPFKESFSPQGDAYQQCWYPLALSKKLGDKQIMGQDYCGGRVILYRDSAGKARVMTAYCKHLGADLSLGTVIGDNVQCAFHNWQYGPDGVCCRIPSGDEIPKQARLFSFPTEEKWGLIWAFFGPEPLYDVPSFPPSVDMSRMIYKTFEYEETDQVDPWWIFTTNVFDFHHLLVVHKIEGLQEYARTVELDVTDHSIGYGGEGGPTVWGVNVDVTQGERPGSAMIGAGMPTGKKTKHFMVEAADIGDGSEEAVAKAEELIAEIHRLHTHIIVEEDIPLISSLNFYEGGLLGNTDRALARYLEYARNYPRLSMAELTQLGPSSSSGAG